jgi:hypothetical protein
MTRTALAFALLLASACVSSSAKKTEPIPHGNPAGFTVHVLTGDSLSAQAVTVNGRTIDTATVESIDASVEQLVAETDAPTTVAEVTGVAPQLTVDFTAAATPVPTTFRGADLQWRSKFFLGNPRWKALVKHLGLGLLRFPGGQERVRYDKDADSTTPDGDTLVVSESQPYEFRMGRDDITNYIALCKDLGIAAEPEIDITIDDVAQAKAMISQIVDHEGYDLKYVSVGNEPDVHAARDGSPDGNWPYLGVTHLTDDALGRPEALAHYTARYLAYRAAIDEVQPGLTYALGELGDGSSTNLGAILGGLGADQPGAVAFHWYLLGDWGQAASEPRYPSLAHLVVTGNQGQNIWALKDYVAAARATAADHHLTAPKVFVGEFGTSWSAKPSDMLIADRLAAAIFNAEAQETGKAAGADSMQWFGLSDPSAWTTWVPSLIAVDDDGTPHVRPQYYVYVLYKELYGDETVAVPSAGQDADASLYASRKDDRHFFLLINRTADRRVTRVVKATTASGDRLLKLTSYPHSVAVVEF